MDINHGFNREMNPVHIINTKNGKDLTFWYAYQKLVPDSSQTCWKARAIVSWLSKSGTSRQSLCWVH